MSAHAARAGDAKPGPLWAMEFPIPPSPLPPTPDQTAPPPGADDDPHAPITAALRQLIASNGTTAGLTVEQMLSRLGQRSSGLAVLLVGMLTFVPGAAVPFSLAVMVLGAAMLRGDAQLRLPGMIAQRRLPASLLGTALPPMLPVLRWAERHTRPRAPALCHGAALRLGGLAVILNAVLIALPIPLGNTMPAIALIWLGLGFAAGDGLMTAGGFALTLLALAADAALVFGSIEAVMLAF